MRTIKNGLIVATILIGQHTVAGETATHGGGVHLCPGKGVESYDIYEGRERYNIPTTVRSGTTDEIVEEILQDLNKKLPRLALEISDEVAYVKNNIKFVDKDIANIHDTGMVMVDPGCRYEQAASWDKYSGKIFVSNALYSQMDSFNRAALLTHEAVYSWMRKNLKVKTSDFYVRKTVASLASGKTDFWEEWMSHEYGGVSITGGLHSLPPSNVYFTNYKMAILSFYAPDPTCQSDLVVKGVYELNEQAFEQVANRGFFTPKKKRRAKAWEKAFPDDMGEIRLVEYDKTKKEERLIEKLGQVNLDNPRVEFTARIPMGVSYQIRVSKFSLYSSDAIVLDLKSVEASRPDCQNEPETYKSFSAIDNAYKQLFSITGDKMDASISVSTHQ